MRFIGHFLFHVVATAVLFWAVETYVFPGSFAILGEGLERYAIVAVLFGVLNTFIKPLLKLAMLPVQMFTLGLAGFAVNGILLIGLSMALTMLDVSAVGIMVDHWVMYFAVGVIVGIGNTVIHWVS